MTKAERTILTVGADGKVTSIQVREERRLEPDTSRVLWGWKQIADALDRSERWAKRNGKRLPVSWVNGRPCITMGDLYGWLKAQCA